MTILAKSLQTTKGVYQQLYKCPAGKEATFSINVANMSTTEIKVSMVLLTAAETTAFETAPNVAGIPHYEWNTPINTDPLERTGIILNPGESIAVMSTSTAAAYTVVGVTDSATV